MSTLEYEISTWPSNAYVLRDLGGTSGTNLTAGAVIVSGGTALVTFNEVRVYMQRDGNCTGLTVTCEVRNTASGCTNKQTIGTVSAPTISTSAQEVVFTMSSGSYTAVANDVITFYMNSSSSSDKMKLRGNISGGDYSNTKYSDSASCVWETPVDDQPTLQLWSDSAPPPSEGGVTIPPPPAWVRL